MAARMHTCRPGSACVQASWVPDSVQKLVLAFGVIVAGGGMRLVLLVWRHEMHGL